MGENDLDASQTMTLGGKGHSYNDSDASQMMTLGPNDTGSRKNGDVMFLG